KFLDLCGLTAVPTLAGETQFVSAVTAKGERVEGFAAGTAIDMSSAALLQRTDLTLDKLKKQYDDAVRVEEDEVREYKNEAADERANFEAELKSLEHQREALDKAIRSKDYGGKTYKDRVAERKRFTDRIREVRKELSSGVDKRLKEKIESGPARKQRELA